MLLFGCSAENDIKEVTLTKDQQAEFLESFLVKSDQEEEPTVLIKDLNNHVSGLSESIASESVHILLYTIYQYQEEMNEMAKGLQTAFERYSERGIDFNKEEDLEKVHDKVLKAFLEQTKDRSLTIKKENEQYVVMADYDKILSTYSPYIAKDLKAMIEFSKEESSVPYFNNTTQTLDLDIVASRIVKMEQLSKQHPDSYYVDWMNKSKAFYYKHYFGMNGTSISDSNQALLPDVKEHFTKMKEKHSELNFADDISRFFEEYEKNESKVNENVYVFLLDLTGREHESISQDNASDEEKAKKELEEALKSIEHEEEKDVD